MQHTNATKRNQKLYAQTCMQTITKIEDIETTLPLCLDKTLLFKAKKVKEGK